MCNFETLMSFPEPVIKCTAPQDAEFPWFSLISTEFQGIWCFPATCKTRVQHLEQMSHPNYVLYLQLLILKIFLDKKKRRKISEQPKVCLSFSPCKLQPHFDYVFWSLLPFFSPFAWWHSLSAAIGNIIHSVSIHGTSFSHKYEAKKVCKNTITICRGGKLIFGSQEGERTECFQSAGPTGSERRGPLRNSILSHIFSRQLIFQELKK